MRPKEVGYGMDSGLKFDVQTEGLGEFWGIAPDRHERITRAPMSLEEIEAVAISILEENEQDSSGQIFLKKGSRTLQIDLEGGVFQISDPDNFNYQNISIKKDDLASSILSFFNLLEEPEEARKAGTSVMQWMIAGAAVIISFAAFSFVIRHLHEEFQFMPKPEFMEVEDNRDYQKHLRDMSGVYITNWEDGETLLRLKSDGSWEFYDLDRGGNQDFRLLEVESGECRPVYQKGRLALLTQNFYIFQWESEGVLSFQERRYIRTATNKDEVPFVSFRN